MLTAVGRHHLPYRVLAPIVFAPDEHDLLAPRDYLRMPGLGVEVAEGHGLAHDVTVQVPVKQSGILVGAGKPGNVAPSPGVDGQGSAVVRAGIDFPAVLGGALHGTVKAGQRKIANIPAEHVAP